MHDQDPDEINRLAAEFLTMLENWENKPDAFDWTSLQALAQRGAQAYNEGAGPSFHSVALDGMEHSLFHERFLGFLLDAGFDPFRLANPGSGRPGMPVIDHAGLAEAAASNSCSARMHAALMDAARRRFAPLLDGNGVTDNPQLQAAEACAESIPADLLERLAPQLGARRSSGRRSTVNPLEGYLSSAETAAEDSRPYG